jgi:hypothetical protein
MNLLLGINTVLALLALFATTICILGWVCLWLLRRVARLLLPLAKDEEARRAPARPRERLEARPKTAG